MTATAWTDERIERLKTLWREGRTAGQIAAELQNGVTRSAVLGKVYRMGLSAGRPERPVIRKPPAGRPPRAATELPARSRGGKAPPPPVPEPPSGGVSLLAIRRGQCRWPYGDPRSGVSFCGRPVARGAFCAGHAEAGYRTPPGGAGSLPGPGGAGLTGNVRHPDT